MKNTGAVNSAGECHPHTVEVTGSNPVPPTMPFRIVESKGFLLPRRSRKKLKGSIYVFTLEEGTLKYAATINYALFMAKNVLDLEIYN